MEKQDAMRLGSILAGLGLVITLTFIPINPEVNIWAFVGMLLVLFGVIAINFVEWGINTEPIDLMEAYAALTEEQKSFILGSSYQPKKEVKHGKPEPEQKTDI